MLTNETRSIVLLSKAGGLVETILIKIVNVSKSIHLRYVNRRSTVYLREVFDYVQHIQLLNGK